MVLSSVVEGVSAPAWDLTGLQPLVVCPDRQLGDAVRDRAAVVLDQAPGVGDQCRRVGVRGLEVVGHDLRLDRRLVLHEDAADPRDIPGRRVTFGDEGQEPVQRGQGTLVVQETEDRGFLAEGQPLVHLALGDRLYADGIPHQLGAVLPVQDDELAVVAAGHREGADPGRGVDGDTVGDPFLVDRAGVDRRVGPELPYRDHLDHGGARPGGGFRCCLNSRSSHQGAFLSVVRNVRSCPIASVRDVSQPPMTSGLIDGSSGPVLARAPAIPARAPTADATACRCLGFGRGAAAGHAAAVNCRYASGTGIPARIAAIASAAACRARGVTSSGVLPYASPRAAAAILFLSRYTVVLTPSAAATAARRSFPRIRSPFPGCCLGHHSSSAAITDSRSMISATVIGFACRPSARSAFSASTASWKVVITRAGTVTQPRCSRAARRRAPVMSWPAGLTVTGCRCPSTAMEPARPAISPRVRDFRAPVLIVPIMALPTAVPSSLPRRKRGGAPVTGAGPAASATRPRGRTGWCTRFRPGW